MPAGHLRTPDTGYYLFTLVLHLLGKSVNSLMTKQNALRLRIKIIFEQTHSVCGLHVGCLTCEDIIIVNMKIYLTEARSYIARTYISPAPLSPAKSVSFVDLEPPPPSPAPKV